MDARPIPFTTNNRVLDPPSYVYNDSIQSDILSNENRFTPSSPIPINVQTPTITLNQNDQNEHDDIFLPNTPTQLAINVPIVLDSSTQTLSNTIEVDLNTTALDSGVNTNIYHIYNFENKTHNYFLVKEACHSVVENVPFRVFT